MCWDAPPPNLTHLKGLWGSGHEQAVRTQLHHTIGPLRGRIRRLVLNDNGPSLARAAIERIRSYAGHPPAFATVGELEQYFRTVYKPFGWLSDAQFSASVGEATVNEVAAELAKLRK